MEQHKLETQFKEQLNSREIKPSEMAWQKLDSLLTVAEEKKPKRSYSWLFVAASFVGFVFVATFYFSRKDITIENQKKEVVIEHQVVPKSNAMPSQAIDFKNEEKDLVDNVVQSSVSKSADFSVSKKDSLINKDNLNQNQVAELSIINQKKGEESISSQTKAVTVDEMLAAAKTTLKSENSRTALKVNPNALLSQVDGELELSFREKVINKVNKNYQTVKVVLANRNQE